jgi:Flp pilus assembly pilin Flp
MATPLKEPTERRAVTRLRQMRGAAMAEYTILVGVVAILSIGAFIGLGIALIDSFEARRNLVLYPFP